MRDFVIAVSRNTETAWVSSRMDWQGVSRGEPFTIEGLRMTIVLEKQEGEWGDRSFAWLDSRLRASD